MSSPCRLYLITPPRLDDLAAFARAFREALDAGDVACAQLRLKREDGEAVSDADVLFAAEALLPIAREYDVAFLINDRPDLALKTGADGVHVGQKDASCKKARAVLGEGATVGVTCHDSKHLALVAGEDGADYVAFGAFFPTVTKEASTRADPSLLEWWREATTLPSVAIGGIAPKNCGALVRAGADFLAVSAGVWRNPAGPAAAVKAFNAAIRKA
ncbi:MAG: thiamine phosphate synthase [Parvularculaceae bacterium]